MLPLRQDGVEIAELNQILSGDFDLLLTRVALSVVVHRLPLGLLQLVFD